VLLAFSDGLMRQLSEAAELVTAGMTTTKYDNKKDG